MPRSTAIRSPLAETAAFALFDALGHLDGAPPTGRGALRALRTLREADPLERGLAFAQPGDRALELAVTTDTTLQVIHVLASAPGGKRQPELGIYLTPDAPVLTCRFTPGGFAAAENGMYRLLEKAEPRAAGSERSAELLLAHARRFDVPFVLDQFLLGHYDPFDGRWDEMTPFRLLGAALARQAARGRP